MDEKLTYERSSAKVPAGTKSTLRPDNGAVLTIE
jgi:hypothetical protein